ncbi:MAG: hypothetical protein ACK5VJ_00060 [Pseudomonadota bacterium]
MRKPETTPASLDDKRPRIFVVTNDGVLAAALAEKLGAERPKYGLWILLLLA